MSDYPYPENRGQTHFEGCYRRPRHHNCAVAEIERLTEYNDTLEMLNLSGKELVKRLQARVEALEGVEKEHRWLRSKACVESRDFETPPYAWTIRFRSTCSTVENAIRNAMATEKEGE